MKNLIYLLLVVSTISITNAQTITSDWFYNIGEQETQNLMLDASSIDIPIEQLNGTWDFSNAVVDSIITIDYVDPNTVSQFTDFPNSTVVAQYNNDNNFVFYQEDATSFSILGGYVFNDNNGNPTELFIEYEEPSIIAITPWAIGESIFNSPISTSTENGVQLSWDFVFKEYTIVGNGTVTTPSGTFNNCLMIKIETQPGAGLTAFGDPLLSLEYIFVKDKMSNQIAKYVEDYDFYGGGATEVSFYYNEADPTIGINELSNLGIQLIGQSNNDLLISSDKHFNAQIQLFDVSGKLLQTDAKTINQGNNTLNINDANANSLSMLLIIDEKTGHFKSLKLKF